MATSLRNYPVSNIGIESTAIYIPVTPGIQSTVVGLTLANISTVPVKGSVSLTSSGVTVYVIKNVSIPVGNSLSVVGESKIIMEQDDILQVQSSANNSLDVLLSVIEVVF